MARGLESIVVAETVLGHTDPANGIVSIIFAVSRSAGWLGHAIEQPMPGRMILRLCEAADRQRVIGNLSHERRLMW